MFGSSRSSAPRPAQNKLRKPSPRIQISLTGILAVVASVSFLTWLVLSVLGRPDTPVMTQAQQAQALQAQVEAQKTAEEVKPETYQPMIYDQAARQFIPVDGEPLPEISSKDLRYMLQLGSYGSQAEAEQEKARLALLGFETRISLPIENNAPLYRIEMGPFVGLREKNRMLNRLKREKVNDVITLVMKESSQAIQVGDQSMEARIIREEPLEGRSERVGQSAADVKQPKPQLAPSPPPRTVTPAVKPAQPIAPSVPSGDYWRLQMGSFPDRAGAMAQVDKIEKAGLSAEIMQAQIDGKTVYRVMSKPLTSAAQVESMKALLALHGISHFARRYQDSP